MAKRKPKLGKPHTTLRVMGRDYQVYLLSTTEMSKHGITDAVGGVQFHCRRIFLAPSLDVKQVLLHEIIEILNYELQLGLTHPRIQALENALYQVISDNRLVFHE